MENLEVLNEGRILDHEKVEQEKAESADGILGGSEEASLNLEGGGVLETLINPVDMPTDGPALDEAFRQEDAALHLQPEAPNGQRKIGSQDPAHRIHWRGKDIMGNEYFGSGNDARQCNVDAGLLGSCTCHTAANPAYIEPAAAPVEPEEKPISAFEANDFYRKGFEDGDAAYQDIKTLILAWVTDQMLSSNLGAAQDVDSIPFVVYARNNR